MKSKIIKTLIGFGIIATGMSLAACHTTQGMVEGANQDMQAATAPAPEATTPAKPLHKHYHHKKHHHKKVAKKKASKAASSTQNTNEGSTTETNTTDQNANTESNPTTPTQQ